MKVGLVAKLVSVLDSVMSKLGRYDEGTVIGSFLSFTVSQALFLSTFSVVFRTLLHASTMSQTIPDIHGYSQIFPVSEGMSF